MHKLTNFPNTCDKLLQIKIIADDYVEIERH